MQRCFMYLVGRIIEDGQVEFGVHCQIQAEQLHGPRKVE